MLIEISTRSFGVNISRQFDNIEKSRRQSLYLFISVVMYKMYSKECFQLCLVGNGLHIITALHQTRFYLFKPKH